MPKLIRCNIFKSSPFVSSPLFILLDYTISTESLRSLAKFQKNSANREGGLIAKGFPKIENCFVTSFVLYLNEARCPSSRSVTLQVMSIRPNSYVVYRSGRSILSSARKNRQKFNIHYSSGPRRAKVPTQSANAACIVSLLSPTSKIVEIFSVVFHLN